jgi:hypothetical protein
MGNLRNSIRILFQLLVVVAAIVFLIFAFSRFTNFQGAQIIPNALQQSYPPPSTATPTQSGYPGPQLPQVPIMISTFTITPTPIINAYLFSSPAEATNFFANIKKTPSPSEISAAATYMVMRASIPTKLAEAQKITTPYQQSSFPVKTDADLPNVLYNDLDFFNSSSSYFTCFSARNSIPALFIKSLDPNRPDYYLVPFYINGQLCSLVKIIVNNGYGKVSGATGDMENAPSSLITASEAISIVEEKTGLQITEQPILVFQQLYEGPDAYDPFWQVKASDGQTFYVVILAPQSSDGSFKSNAIVMNAKDTTIIR